MLRAVTNERHFVFIGCLEEVQALTHDLTEQLKSGEILCVQSDLDVFVLQDASYYTSQIVS